MKPLVTLIRQALADRLRQSPEIAAFAGDRIFLNRFEAWGEAGLTTIGVYVISEEPLETDISPPPDERRLTVTVEILSREDAALEERLDQIADQVLRSYTLDPLGELVKAAGGPDTFLKIEWLGNDRGYLPEGEHTIGANIMAFSLEYQQPWADAELPPFETAATDWRAQTPEGEIEAENIVQLDQD